MIPMPRHIHVLAAAILLAAAAVFAPGAGAASSAPVWEVVRTTDADTSTAAASQDSPVDIRVRDGIIEIVVSERAKVEVFTILGQLVTSRTLQPGTVRLTLGQRGIYIVKSDGYTKRVNL